MTRSVLPLQPRRVKRIPRHSSKDCILERLKDKAKRPSNPRWHTVWTWVRDRRCSGRRSKLTGPGPPRSPPSRRVLRLTGGCRRLRRKSNLTGRHWFYVVAMPPGIFQWRPAKKPSRAALVLSMVLSTVNAARPVGVNILHFFSRFLSISFYFFLSTSFFLLLSFYFFLSTSFFLLLSFYSFLSTSFFLLLSFYFFLSTSFFLLLSFFFFLFRSFYFIHFLPFSFSFFLFLSLSFSFFLFLSLSFSVFLFLSLSFSFFLCLSISFFLLLSFFLSGQG